jgi:hypothetical protein
VYYNELDSNGSAGDRGSSEWHKCRTWHRTGPAYLLSKGLCEIECSLQTYIDLVEQLRRECPYMLRELGAIECRDLVAQCDTGSIKSSCSLRQSDRCRSTSRLCG